MNETIWPFPHFLSIFPGHFKLLTQAAQRKYLSKSIHTLKYMLLMKCVAIITKITLYLAVCGLYHFILEANNSE